MDILILSNKMPYPPKDGGAIATLSMARSFAELGHKVTMLVMNTSKHYYDIQKVPEELAKQIEFIGVDVNTDISALKALKNFLFSSIPYNAQRFITPEYNQALTGLLTSRSFDVIQLEGPYLGPYIRTIRKHSSALISMRPHNVEHEIWEQTAHITSGFKKLYLNNLAKRIKRLETSTMNNYDVIVPITGRDAAKLVELGCNIPVHVAPTGINSFDFQPDFENYEHPCLFHLGALDWPPNQEGLKWFFAKAWPLILAEFPTLKFYLAGRNAPPHIANISEPNVEYLGEVENAHDFIRSKAIMVVPLFSGSGLRIKIIEGMALGKAIITTGIGLEGISGTHRHNIMVADTPNEFLEAARYLLKSRENVTRLGKAAAAFIRQHYDNQIITRSLCDFYIKNLP